MIKYSSKELYKLKIYKSGIIYSTKNTHKINEKLNKWTPDYRRDFSSTKVTLTIRNLNSKHKRFNENCR